MSDQDNRQVSTLQRPISDDPEAWKAYWEAQGWPWRTGPEIDAERQKYLAERRTIKPDIEQGIYPFKDIKLSRADVEWLLATHENGRGPVDWKDESQRRHEGLDLRGADLRLGDLQGLPLSRMHGGLTVQEWNRTTMEQHEMAAIHLEGANLWDAQLEESFLRGAHLEGVNLHWTRLDSAGLGEAHLEGANLRRGYLKGAFLQHAHLEGVDLYAAHLEGAYLRYACLEGKLTPSNILDVQRYDGNFPSVLPPANLQYAFFDSGTNLDFAKLGDKKHGFVTVADVHWSDANLAVVKWSLFDILGDERKARQKMRRGQRKDATTLIDEYETAVRANRQLAVALQIQGLNEDASRFAYRAQLCQRIVLRHQKKFGQYFFSGFLDLLAGYGYRPGRSVIWYLFTIFGFALAYFAIGHLPFFPDAFVFSLTSFHGRGFFPGLGSENSLHNPLVIMAAFEAVIGLLIEISFIATFTQRFFGR